MTIKLFTILGAINGFLSVALGAFGAHILDGRVSEYGMEIWDKAVTYQMLHALALLFVALLAGKYGRAKQIKWAGWLFFFGILIFSGSLYVLALTKISMLGAITPIGGVSFLAGWVMVMVIVSVLKLEKNS